MQISKDLILKHFPCIRPYRFIDEILDVDAYHIRSAYTFRKTENFFKGHFKGNPVVPGAILQEAAAQTGLLAFGMYLLGNGIDTLTDIPVELPEDIRSMSMGDLSVINKKMNLLFYLTSADMNYKAVVRPQEKIIVYSEKLFFRLNKLKCAVRIENEQEKLVSKGVLSGIVVNIK